MIGTMLGLQVAKGQRLTLISIQVLRAIAALAVVVAHLWPALYSVGYNDFPNFLVGAAGVDLFFVISGFVIVYSSEQFFGQFGASAYFFARRLVRIVPLYWGATTVWLLGLWLIGHWERDGVSWQNVFASYAFWPTRLTTPVLGVGWTLNYEMFFYAIFAVAVIFSRRAAVVAVTVFFLVLIWYVRHATLASDNPLLRWANPLIYEFAYGMFIALAFREGLRIPRWAALAMVAGGLAMIAWTGMDASGITIIPRHMIWGGGAAAVVAGAVLAPYAQKPPSVPLRFAAWGGDASYALYLSHPITAAVAGRVLIKLVDHPSKWILAGFILVASLIAAAFVHLIERRVTRHLQKRIAFLKPPVLAAPETLAANVISPRKV